MPPSIDISEHDCEIRAVHGSGPGGQHVNKVATSILLRFDIHKSSLVDSQKVALLKFQDKRISSQGIITIQVSEHKSQLRNKEEAFKRLKALIQKATYVPKKRKATKPTKASKERRLKAKSHRSKLKKMRGKVED